MGIVLGILKWILIILAAIVGLLLFLCALVIWVPARYEARLVMGTDKKFQYKFRASWLLHLVSIYQNLDEDDVTIRIAFIKLGNKKKKKKVKQKPKSESKSESESKAEPRVEQKPKSEPEPEPEPEPELESKPKPKTPSKNKKKKKKSKKKKKGFSFGKISSIIKFIRDQGTKASIRVIKDEIIRLIRYAGPKKVKGFFHYGMDDPATTGLITGGISMFPFAYQKGFQVQPDFEQEILEFDVTVRGRIRAFYLLRLALRIYRNDDIKRLRKQFKKLKEAL